MPKDQEPSDVRAEALTLLDEKASTREISRPSFRKLVSFLADLFTPDIFRGRRPSSTRLGATAWLDGLRGWAALTVCLVHMTVYTHLGMELCYGAKLPQEEMGRNISPIALPIIRLPFLGGHFAVMLFFTISGFVVPRRLLQLLHEGRQHEYLVGTRSALIRRPIRLYIPVLMSTFLVFCVWHILGITVAFPPTKSNIFAEFWNWLNETLLFMYFFRQGFLFTPYNGHTWTIPVELRGSLFIVIWLYAFHTIHIKRRILATIVMCIYLNTCAPGGWYASFFAGMILSEMDLLAAQASTQRVSFFWDGFLNWIKRRKLMKALYLHTLLLISLYLASEPSSDWDKKEDVFTNCYGWETLGRMIPWNQTDGNANFRWFWLFWASWIFLYVVKELRWFRWALETRFSQYLGRISFALYLVHGPMIGMLGERLFYLTAVKKPLNEEQEAQWGGYYDKWHGASWWFLNDGGHMGLEPNFLFCVALCFPCFLYAAEVGTRLFDEPSVKASRWVWERIKGE
ncbi:hypothetical protein K470DRAFT_226821 [Piedraia hortae CBS 480.64]|uniref:Acyltransferase 3 domain-containing protein n=1 Tax=Piedraia hortae CBS 480.64 TaxID=1314780 RepID=A0A6A7C7Y6_9PEZI|nr:hypothetical protein K470DRAFT_226821 [Piedraia hortae CBS 480.64]